MFLLVLSLFGFHGVISNDTTWSDTAYLTGDVWVNSGVTLTIAPGTVVLYADSCEWDTAWCNEDDTLSKLALVDLVIEGNLKSLGAETDSIYFTSINEEDGKHGVMICSGGWDSLAMCSFKAKEYQHDPIYIYSANALVSFSLFSGGLGLEGKDSQLEVTNCNFHKGGGKVISLDEGSLSVSEVSIINPLLYGEYEVGWDETGIGILGKNLSSFLINSVIMDSIWAAYEFVPPLYGIEGYGIVALNCNHVRINLSEIRGVEGGRAIGSGGGCGGSGGGAYGLYIDSCMDVVVGNNLISGVLGANGDDGSVAGGGGGSGFGIYIINCEQVSVEDNEISRISGGSKGYATSDEGSDGHDGNGYSLVCNNTCPTITNNEFNRSDISILIGSTSQPVIGGAQGKGNLFIKSEGYVIYNNSPNEIDATWNTWTSPAMIDSLIFDYYDDPTKGIVHYDNFTDVEEESVTQPFTLRSNLVNDVLHVSLSRDYPDREVQLGLFDASGRRVLSMPVSSSEIEIDVSAFPRGVYFVSVNTPEEPCITRKVILN